MLDILIAGVLIVALIGAFGFFFSIHWSLGILFVFAVWLFIDSQRY
jgi:hypothetical protein